MKILTAPSDFKDLEIYLQGWTSSTFNRILRSNQESNLTPIQYIQVRVTFNPDSDSNLTTGVVEFDVNNDKTSHVTQLSYLFIKNDTQLMITTDAVCPLDFPKAVFDQWALAISGATKKELEKPV